MVYFDYIKVVFKSAMQYRASLFTLMISNFIIYFGYFYVLVLLFERFGSLAGWAFEEVALCFGITNLAYYVCMLFAVGFDRLEDAIRNGNFDRLLLRPRGLILQVLGQEMHFASLGRIAQPLIILVYSVSLFDNWTHMQTFGLILMVLSGFVIFTGVQMLCGTVCFWTIKGLEFLNIFNFGGREVSSYPLPIFGKWFTRFFTFVLPYATFNYLPLQYIVGRTDNPAYLLYPVAGMLFIFPCILVWRIGVRHYASTGS